MKTLIQTIALLFGIGILAAQENSPFWSETFSGRDNFLAKWTDGGQNSGAQTWKWSDNPREATFGKQPVFASTSVSNGYILFNSDANGDHPFQKTITSSAIGIAGKKSIFVRFETQYAYFSKKDLVQAELGYSFNGTDFTYIPVLESVAKNTLVDSVLIQILQIPLSGPQERLYLQFRWKGRYEYAWKIDDISLYENNPRPSNDLALTYPKGAHNFVTPLSQVKPMDFAVMVTNAGTLVQDNIQISACVSFEGMEIFKTSATLAQLFPDSIASIDFDLNFSPKIKGNYTIQYQVKSTTMDQLPANNTLQMPFVVSEDLFSKDDYQIIGATQPSAPESDHWQAGNLYHIQQSGYMASKAHISVMSPEGPNGYEGSSVAVFLYAVKPDADRLAITDENLEVKGYGSYTFGSEPPFEVVVLDLFDIATGNPGILLEPEADYLLSVQYPNHLLAPYSTLPYFYDYATVVKNASWFPGGFGPGVTVVARMEIAAQQSQATPVRSLKNIANINLYPNPSTDVVHLRMDAGADPIVGYRILDLQGKVHRTMHQVQSDRSGEYQIPVHQLPAGTYLLDLGSATGRWSIPFIKR